VNFWQPSGSRQFKTLQEGELFLFKLHAPQNFIVGGGVFFRSSLAPLSIAWEAFGIRNGARTPDEMRARVTRYRRDREPDVGPDYQVGCIVLTQPFFGPEERWIPVPEPWTMNIVSGRSYDLADADGRRLWEACAEGAASSLRPGAADPPAPRYGEPVLVRPRLGQGAFRLAITEAYARRCVVTQEKTLPALEAAHIRPYARGGTHEISNGLLLRRDLHALFDLGYVTVTQEGRFEVSRRIREDYENGRHSYALARAQITMPAPRHLAPDRANLE
jgi:putative restriction endonuclease